MASVRKRARAVYHYVIRFDKKQIEVTQAQTIAAAVLNKRNCDFWKEVNKMNPLNVKLPTSVDLIQSISGMRDLFAKKYSKLPNSVGFDKNSMAEIKQEIYQGLDTKSDNTFSCDKNCICKNFVTLEIIHRAISHINLAKRTEMVIAPQTI